MCPMFHGMGFRPPKPTQDQHYRQWMDVHIDVQKTVALGRYTA